MPQVRALVETLEERVLATFANIESEPNEKAEREWKEGSDLLIEEEKENWLWSFLY